MATSTTTTLATVPAGTAAFGQTVTLIAVVIPATYTAIPTGTVTFKDGATTLGTAALIGGGVAILTVSNLSVSGGPHSLTAVYSGDATYATSTSAPVTLTITAAATMTSLTSSANPSVFGQPVTFTATVTLTPPGGGTPTGSVTFTIDGVPQAPVPLVGNQASIALSGLSVGNHTVTATYTNTDGNYAGSTSNTVTQVVAKANTMTTLTSSPNPSTPGQTVTFTATVIPVSPGAGTLTGMVTFTIDGAPQPPVALAGNTAIFTTNTLTNGTHTVTSTYGGDTNFNSSTSNTVTQVVSTTINTSLTATPAMIKFNVNTGQFFIPTLSATLTNTNTSAGIPNKTITFTANPLTGPVTLGTAVTDATGTATLTNVPVQATLITTDHYTATFAGDATDSPATADASLTFQPL
ncbi:Ig-like domain repeat protein [Saccharopolyspora hattusasensis]|uniref:Ig-like domain-containing protein n=1 Tax=Saccharopolyspora hattusasensis TaxID=1128679 RepID=UPI003D9529C7